MIEFFGTLGAVVALGLGALVPGLAAGNAERALQDRFPGARPQVRIEADPFVQLPRGFIPRLTVDLDGAELGPLAIPELDLEARDLQVPPGAVWGFVPPELLAPAPVTVRFGGSADAWRASIAKAVSSGKIDDLPLPKNPLGIAAGGADAMELTFEAGRLGAVMRAPGKLGAVLEVRASFVPTIVEDGRVLVMGEPRVRIGGKELPAALLRLAGAAPLIDLRDQDLPGRDWRFKAFAVDEAGLRVELGGVLEKLPKK